MRKKKNRDSGKKTRRRKGKRRPASSEGPVIKRGGREGLQVSIFAEWEVGDVTVFTKSKDQLAGGTMKRSGRVCPPRGPTEERVWLKTERAQQGPRGDSIGGHVGKTT